MLSDNYFKNGLTFTSWIWVDKIEDQETQVILDSRGPYESDDMSVSKSFHLWLKKGIFGLYMYYYANEFLLFLKTPTYKFILNFVMDLLYLMDLMR